MLSIHQSSIQTNVTLKDKKFKSSICHTQAVTEAGTQRQSKPSSKLPCVLCQDSEHQLHCCPDFKRKSRRKYVVEKRLCYGCLKTGLSAKDCCKTHSCEKCKGRHPSLLHYNNYSKAKPTLDSNQGVAEETATTLALCVTTKEPLHWTAYQ